jgi:hypothetical protein
MTIKCLLGWVTAALCKVDSSYFGLEVSKAYLISFITMAKVVVIQLFIYLWAYSAA